MSMVRTNKFLLAAALLIAGATSSLAASEADYKAALAAAEAANKEAAGLRNQWTVTAAAIAAAKKAAEAGDFDKAVASSNEADGIGEGVDLPGRQRKDTLERYGNSLSSFGGAETSHDYPPPGIRHPRGRRDARRELAAVRARRRHAGRLRSRTLRQCPHPAHDRHPCAVAAGVFPRTQRQSRHRRDGRKAAASGRPRLSRTIRHPARQRRRLCLHLSGFRKIRRPLRQARRLRASENLDRPAAQRRRDRPLAAARWRRSVAGHAGSPTPCRAPTWSRPPTCSASRQ